MIETRVPSRIEAATWPGSPTRPRATAETNLAALKQEAATRSSLKTSRARQDDNLCQNLRVHRVSGPRKKGKRLKSSNSVQRALRNPFCKEKAIIISEPIPNASLPTITCASQLAFVSLQCPRSTKRSALFFQLGERRRYQKARCGTR